MQELLDMSMAHMQRTIKIMKYQDKSQQGLLVLKHGLLTALSTRLYGWAFYSAIGAVNTAVTLLWF